MQFLRPHNYMLHITTNISGTCYKTLVVVSLNGGIAVRVNRSERLVTLLIQSVFALVLAGQVEILTPIW